MNSLLGPLTGQRSTYSSISPDSPESDAVFIDSLSIKDGRLVVSNSRMDTRTSLSSADFDDPTNVKKGGRQESWQDTMMSLSQWASSASIVAAETLGSGARYLHTISTQAAAGNGNGAIRLSPSPTASSPPLTGSTTASHCRSYGTMYASSSSPPSSQSATPRSVSPANSLYDEDRRVAVLQHHRAMSDGYNGRRSGPSDGRSEQVRRRCTGEQSYGRGIDRDYLHESKMAATVNDAGVVGYLGGLVDRFTAPKVRLTPDKLK